MRGILRDVIAYWGSVWYEEVTEDEYQSGGHCGIVALALALGRSTFRYFLGGVWPTGFNKISCRFRTVNVLNQKVLVGSLLS